MKDKLAVIAAQVYQLAKELSDYPVLQKRMQDTLADLEKEIEREELRKTYLIPLQEFHDTVSIKCNSSDSLNQLNEAFVEYRDEIRRVIGYH